MPHRPELTPLAYRNDRRRRISTAVVLMTISVISLPFWLMGDPPGGNVVSILYALILATAASFSAHLWLGPRPILRTPATDTLPLATAIAPSTQADPPPLPLNYAARMPRLRPRDFPWWVDLIILPICLSLLAIVGWSMLNCCLVPGDRLRMVLAAVPGAACLILACGPSTARTHSTHLWWLIGTSVTLLTTPLAMNLLSR